MNVSRALFCWWAAQSITLAFFYTHMLLLWGWDNTRNFLYWLTDEVSGDA